MESMEVDEGAVVEVVVMVVEGWAPRRTGLGSEAEWGLEKILSGRDVPPVCRTTGLVTRKHFSLCALSMLEKRKRWPHTSQG